MEVTAVVMFFVGILFGWAVTRHFIDTDYADDLEKTVHRQNQDLLDHSASLDLRHRADMRAIKRWREANPGNDLVMPDHADLVVWLLDELVSKVPKPEHWAEGPVSYAEYKFREMHPDPGPDPTWPELVETVYDELQATRRQVHGLRFPS